MTLNRPQGLLTQDQRKYLAASEDEREKEYTRQQRYRRRKGIRQRVKNGLLDMALVQQRLEEKENQREKIFDELFAEGEGGSEGYAALFATAAFAFEGARRRGLPMAGVAEEAAEAAVGREVGGDLRVRATAELSVEITDPTERTPAPASAAEKLNNGAEIAELDMEEREIVLRYVDARGLTTDEVEGDELLEWWMELGEETPDWE